MIPALLVRAAAFLLARDLRACAVCFGQTDNPDLPRAFTWGLAVMIGATFFVLASFVYALFRVERAREAHLAKP